MFIWISNDSQPKACLLLLQQFLEMRSELIQSTPLEDTLSTQAFILQKCSNPERAYPHPTRTETIPEPTFRLSSKSALLVFNPDSKCYTPSFIDPAEKDSVIAYDSELRQGFEEKIELAEGKGTILIPKPSSDYCFVCQENFQDYLKHLAHPVHQKNVESSYRQTLIFELIEEFGRKRPTPSGFAQASEGRKRVKLEENQGPKSKTEALFKDASTNLPLSSQPKVNYYTD